tara:strand:- start:9591 stop:10610 length:1020 start_codon:yes stop_codon:yes gene_type:complete
MMISPVTSITRAATRKIKEPLNILTFPTHERYESMLAKCGHNFYAYRAQGIKDWNTNYADIPDNYFLLDPDLGEEQIPEYVDFDLVLSQNKFGQFQIAKKLAGMLHLPLVSLEHTLPIPTWGEDVLESTRQMRGHLNLFISRYSIDAWGWQEGKDTLVITHGVDTDLFKPNNEVEREDHILSVVNDWINRDWCCGFGIWQNVIKGLPFKVVGDTPGLSEPASSTEELVASYQNSRIFLNTSTISPVPTALLEAMSCGCAIVTTATCMIPEIVENGVNGFISNDMDELKEYLVMLLNDEDLAEKMGKAARKTIVDRFSVERFASKWDFILNTASKKVFVG